jgi:hypothetical protein
VMRARAWHVDVIRLDWPRHSVGDRRLPARPAARWARLVALSACRCLPLQDARHRLQRPATETLLRRSSRYIRLTRRRPVVADVFASTSGPTRAAFCSAPSLDRGVVVVDAPAVGGIIPYRSI